MAKKVIVSSDSTCDLSPELLRKYHVKITPLSVELDGKFYRDGVDVQPDDVYAYYDRTGKLAKSSACNMEEYREFFEQYTKEGCAVVHISLSSELSGSHRNALAVARELEDVYVIDSLNLSSGTGLLVLKAAELVQQGMEASQIAQQVSALVNKVDASFVVDTLEYLHAGGRCSAVAKLGANLLKLKPSIQVMDGKMGVSKKYRGKLEQTQKQYIADKLSDLDDIDFSRAFVTHSGMPQQMIDEFVAEVKRKAPFQEVLVTRAGCVITVHCGPQTAGVLFIHKKPLQK